MTQQTVVKKPTLNEEMTLDEKLAAIDAAMAMASKEENQKRVQAGLAPIDPADLTMCEGCQ